MAMGIQSICNSMPTTLGWACEELFWSPSFMGIADFILAGEGDLYDMNEYHMLAHIIIRNKVDDFCTICSRLYCIYLVLCVLYIYIDKYIFIHV